MKRFTDWFLRMDIDYDTSEYRIGSPMFWRAIQVIAVILLIMGMFSLPAHAELSQDGGGTWRINTFGKHLNSPHYMLGTVYYEGKGGTLFESLYGSAETRECSNNIIELKAAAKARLGSLLKQVLAVIPSTYGVSIAISVCHPERYVIYLHNGVGWASKEAYNSIILQ